MDMAGQTASGQDETSGQTWRVCCTRTSALCNSVWCSDVQHACVAYREAGLLIQGMLEKLKISLDKAYTCPTKTPQNVKQPQHSVAQVLYTSDPDPQLLERFDPLAVTFQLTSAPLHGDLTVAGKTSPVAADSACAFAPYQIELRAYTPLALYLLHVADACFSSATAHSSSKVQKGITPCLLCLDVNMHCYLPIVCLLRII